MAAMDKATATAERGSPNVTLLPFPSRPALLPSRGFSMHENPRRRTHPSSRGCEKTVEDGVHIMMSVSLPFSL